MAGVVVKKKVAGTFSTRDGTWEGTKVLKGFMCTDGAVSRLNWIVPLLWTCPFEFGYILPFMLGWGGFSINWKKHGIFWKPVQLMLHSVKNRKTNISGIKQYFNKIGI